MCTVVMEVLRCLVNKTSIVDEMCLVDKTLRLKINCVSIKMFKNA